MSTILCVYFLVYFHHSFDDVVYRYYLVPAINSFIVASKRGKSMGLMSTADAPNE